MNFDEVLKPGRAGRAVRRIAQTAALLKRDELTERFEKRREDDHHIEKQAIGTGPQKKSVDAYVEPPG